MADQKRNTIFPGCSQRPGDDHEAFHSLPDSQRGRLILTETPKLLDTPEPSEVLQRPNLFLEKVPIKPSAVYKADLVPVHQGSPWSRYEKGYKLQLGGSIAVIRTIPVTSDLFTIRSFTSDSAEKKLYMLRQFGHENILASYETFFFQNAFYVISEHAEISCNELIVARPNEVQLAAIIHQILDGIIYLASQRLTHGAITSSDILLTKKGIVKIANLENCCVTTSEHTYEDVEALGQVMKQLMEMGSEHGRLGLQRPDNWSLEAVDFLSLTMTASPSKLAEVNFIISQILSKDD